MLHPSFFHELLHAESYGSSSQSIINSLPFPLKWDIHLPRLHMSKPISPSIVHGNNGIQSIERHLLFYANNTHFLRVVLSFSFLFCKNIVNIFSDWFFHLSQTAQPSDCAEPHRIVLYRNGQCYTFIRRFKSLSNPLFSCIPAKS